MVKKGLGKGLGALIPGNISENIGVNLNKEEILYIPINKIKSNPNQPRKDFDDEKISELAQSIKENGLIQPIIVRQEGAYYQIVAGERRYRACKLLGQKDIPAISRDFDDNKTSRVALIENIQRQDLNPLEEAIAYQNLIAEHGLTQGELGDILGKSRSAVTNTLRLLELPKEVQQMLKEEEIFMGHARALLALGNKNKIRDLAKEIIKKGLSVRQTERMVKTLTENKSVPEVTKVENVELGRVKENLQMLLSTKVNIKGSEKKGRIEIEYYSLEELNRIIDIFGTK